MVPPTDDTPMTDRAEALMREVGAQLRDVRVERGEDLDEVAAYLRIKPLYLYGIERGDMSVMPGRTYALGFLRTYADYLGFDGEDLIEQIRSTVSDLTGRTRFHLRAPLPESRVPKLPLLVASAAMLAGIYAGWAYVNRAEEPPVEQIPEVPAELHPIPPAMETDPPPVTAGSDEGPPESEAAPVDPPTATAADRPGNEGIAGTGEPPVTDDASTDLAAAPGGSETGAELSDVTDGPAAALDDSPAGPADPTPPEASGIETIAPAAGTAAPEERDGGDGPATTELPDRPLDLEPIESPPPPGDETAATADPGVPDDPGAEPDAAAEPSGNEDLIAQLLADLPADGEGPRVLETVNADARVILRATSRSWVQIRSESGDYLRTRTLEPGDTFLVPNRDDLVLWTGNAGALEFVVDGEAIAPLGPDGTVIRDVPLEPAALLERAREPG